jgi:hypothetical protein
MQGRREVGRASSTVPDERIKARSIAANGLFKKAVLFGGGL